MQTLSILHSQARVARLLQGRGVFMALGLATVFAMQSTLSSAQMSEQARDQMAILYAEKQNPDPTESKMDFQLRLAVQKATGRGRANQLPKLRTLQPDKAGRLEIEIVTVDVAGAARVAGWIESSLSGAQVKFASSRHAKVRALIPIASIPLLAARADVRKLQRYIPPITYRGSKTSDGTLSHRVPQALRNLGATGAGIKIGVLSDGVFSLAASQAAGDLPPDVTIIPGQEGYFDEGTAILEIVHDMAPDAKLFFATAFEGIESFADNVRSLRTDYGCDIIVDDVYYFSESPFQDSIVARAADDVVADGALFFSAAGNGGNLNDGTSGTWEGDFKLASTNINIHGSLQLAGIHDFGTNALSNPVLGEAGGVLKWADPAGASTNDYDLFVFDESMSTILGASLDSQDGDDDPFEFASSYEPNARFVVARASGEVRMLSLVNFSGGLSIATAGFVSGHAAAQGAVAVAAVEAQATPFLGTNRVETFSSDGPRRIFMDADGNLLPGAPAGVFTSTGGVVRGKPDLAAADGVATGVPDFDPFYGTSAAAPHAAAIAGLVWGLNPALANTQVVSILKATAIDIEAPGPDRDSGFGIVNAYAAALASGGSAYAALSIGAIGAVEVAGDGDAFPESDEVWSLSVAMQSLSPVAVQGVAATISSTNSEVQVLQPMALYGTVPGHSTNVNGSPLSFRIVPPVVDGRKVHFAVAAMSTNAGSPTGTFELRLGAPGLTVTNSIARAGVRIPDAVYEYDGMLEVPFQLNGLNPIYDVDLSIDGSVPSTDVNSDQVGIAFANTIYLALKLISPSGTERVLLLFGGDQGTNLCQTYFDDDASKRIGYYDGRKAPFVGRFRPEQPLSEFIGENPNGTWRLQVIDLDEGDEGRFYAASLILTPRAGDGNSTGSGSTTSGSTSAGSTTSGSTTSGSTTSGSTSAGSSSAGTSGGSTGNRPELLPWTVEIQKPKPGKAVRLKAKSGVGTVAGVVTGTGIETKTKGVEIELAFAVSNRAVVPFASATKVGKVNRKGSVKFLAKKFGADQDLAKGTKFQIWARAARPNSSFTTNTTATNRSDYTVK